MIANLNGYKFEANLENWWKVVIIGFNLYHVHIYNNTMIFKQEEYLRINNSYLNQNDMSSHICVRMWMIGITKSPNKLLGFNEL